MNGRRNASTRRFTESEEIFAATRSELEKMAMESVNLGKEIAVLNEGLAGMLQWQAVYDDMVTQSQCQAGTQGGEHFQCSPPFPKVSESLR